MSEQTPRAGAEAARLVAAAQDWLRTSAPHIAPVDADGRTCACPVCRGIARLREGDPDTVGRWVDGAVAAFEHVVSEAAAGMAAATAGGADDGPAPPPHDDGGDQGSAAPPQGQAGHDGPPHRSVRRVPLDEPGTSAPARRRPAREE